MSYQDLARGASGAKAETSGLLKAQHTRSVESMLLKLANNISALKKQVDLLGGPKDTVDHRHRISDTNNTIQDLARQIRDALTHAHGASSSSLPPDQQLKNKKLLQDFATMLQDYKATQKLAQDRESLSLPKPNPPSSSTARGVAGLPAEQAAGGGVESAIEQQALLQAQKEREAAAMEAQISHNESLIEERDAGIREIARQIGEVNEMFQDLAVLINDQGVQIRTIDEAISSTAERTKEASRELVKAERSQRSYRNKCLWLWLIAAVVVSLIIILLFA